MASVSEQLLAALDDLETDKLKRFKWHLKNDKGFSAAALEKADAPDTVDLMMKRFRPEEAVKITVNILRKMNHNHLAEELENKHKQDQVEGSIEDPALAGAELKPTEVTFTNIVPRTRNDFLQYSHQLTLDPNTVNKRLRLSENNRVITVTGTDQCILIIQTDLMCMSRCCVERVCVDAVTGRLSGVGMCIYQCHIRASAGRDKELSVSLDVMISPGVCSALATVTHSDTIT
ncbi:uncharacterized protein LOC127161824 [Labeo rohita]|uniref:uncharacterized protein LOC127161824 n=1 Tax=Labeo rohita TaxID=84645 RepID=UPI0021E25A82|nr:uncharacterized protein LOC127161824 [Labeo rohita]XP_050960529.1 uncharacterized protein LOC127161824 [Labeo rohita]XP_050960530.1 uncharacterized protein LOC127161824 [Labeo rohita]